MRVCVRLARSAATVVAALLMVACSGGAPSSPAVPEESSTRLPTPAHPTPSSETPAPTVATGTPAHARAVGAAVRVLTTFLDEWAAHGPTRAGRYLVEEQRVTSDEGTPRLVSGTVVGYELYRWHDPSRFTLGVSLDLRFRGSPLAWNRGENYRFVTARRHGQHGPYLLEFATSP